jgi:hypothetical protein
MRFGEGGVARDVGEQEGVAFWVGRAHNTTVLIANRELAHSSDLHG